MAGRTKKATIILFEVRNAPSMAAKKYDHKQLKTSETLG